MSFRNKLIIAIIATICGIALWAANDVGQSGATEPPKGGDDGGIAFNIDTICVEGEVVVTGTFGNAEGYPLNLTVTVGEESQTEQIAPGGEVNLEFYLGVTSTPGGAMWLSYQWLNATSDYEPTELGLQYPPHSCEESTTTTTVVLEPTTTLPEVQLGTSQTLVCTPEVNAVTPCGVTTTTTVPLPSGGARLAISG